jgi:hypothetical protein
LVKKWKLPVGTLLRIFLVEGTVDNQDDEDHSYTIDWVADKQYWYEIIHDPSKDRDGRSRQILMVDGTGKTDTFVVPRTANVTQIRDLWARIIEVPHDVEMHLLAGNEEDHHWSLESMKEPAACTSRAVGFHGDIRIFSGSPHFEADQIGRLLDFKVPPLALCQSSPRRNLGPVIQYDAGVVPLGLRILKQHVLVWNLGGTMLRAPQITTWWVPYNLEAIMRYGHTVNANIPEDPNEAEFPPLPWGNEVTIRIKSHVVPQVPTAPLPADGSQGPSAPGSPSGWRGPALGQAPAIDPAAAALSWYRDIS